MSVSVSDSDLEKISLEYIQYPDTRAVLVQGFNETQVFVNDVLDTDNGNKEFTDFYRNLVSLYSTESNYLGEDSYTNPVSESLLDQAAQKDEEFFPATPPVVWTNLQPQIKNSNNGLPRSPYGGSSDIGGLLAIETQLDGIINGISGSGNSQIETEYITGSTTIRLDDVTVFSVDDFIFASSLGDALFAQITAINKDPDCVGSPNEDETSEVVCTGNGGTWNPTTVGELVISVLQAPTSNLPVSTNVTSSISGFTNEEREESVSLTLERQAQLDIFKQLVDNSVQSHEDFYDSLYLLLLNSNGDLKNKTDIENNISSINTIKSAIDTWQSAPSTNPSGSGTESRFGDIEIANLQAAIDARQSYITTRISEVQSALGSVSQAGNGSFSGNGIFYDFFDWENKRVNAATGSRAKYYNALLALEVQQQQIDDLDSNRAEQDVYFTIEAFTAAGDGSSTIQVSDSSGFNISDEIKVFAQGQPTLTGTLQSKTVNSLTLDITISAAYAVESLARAVKRNG